MIRELSVAGPHRGGHSTRMSLLEEVREGENVDAWRAFVDAYTPLVYGYCRQRGLQASDACDVTQNVFLAVSRAMRSFHYDPQRGRFRSWLGTITCREIRRYLTWANRWRHGGGDAAPQLAELEQGLQSEWETQSTVFLFHQALREVQSTFPDDVWRAFELTWLDDAAPAEVARQLDRPVAWVYKARFRVLGRLRQAVERLSDDVPMRPR